MLLLHARLEQSKLEVVRYLAQERGAAVLFYFAAPFPLRGCLDPPSLTARAALSQFAE